MIEKYKTAFEVLIDVKILFKMKLFIKERNKQYITLKKRII